MKNVRSFASRRNTLLKKFAVAAAGYASRVSRNDIEVKNSGRKKDKGRCSIKIPSTHEWSIAKIPVGQTRSSWSPSILKAYLLGLMWHTSLRVGQHISRNPWLERHKLREIGTQVAVPNIYDNAEVVLLEMVRSSTFSERILSLTYQYILPQIPGECLEDVWVELKPKQIMMVYACLGELFVKLFDCHKQPLCSETNIAYSPPRSVQDFSDHRAPVPLSQPFDKGPLLHREPSKALTSTHDYLVAFSKWQERIPNGSGPDAPFRSPSEWLVLLAILGTASALSFLTIQTGFTSMERSPLKRVIQPVSSCRAGNLGYGTTTCR
ncbi:hypothetical protein OF83DRAFT_1088559 [Amylostereum chailletii]|nr:hypothetical protein OF83DRAFT_1088559 [Amylostereum chailletii]